MEGELAGRNHVTRLTVQRNCSIAGLLSAAVCAEHFEKVVVIEAEGSPEQLGTDYSGLQETTPSEVGPTRPVSRRKRVGQYAGPHREYSLAPHESQISSLLKVVHSVFADCDFDPSKAFPKLARRS